MIDETLKHNIDSYKSIVLSVIPRILGFLDRNRNSETYGCFERYFWHYKLIDFPNARFQEGALLLALLFRNNFNGDSIYRNEIVSQWSISAIKFWGNTRNKNGSTNEVYPYENSFCATAMSTYAISEAILILGERELIDIERTGLWLARNSNLEVSNQEAGASIALLNINLISGSKYYLEAAEKKIGGIIKNQDKSGYYPEYDGYDIGYHSLTLSLLSIYYKKKESKELLNSIKKGIQFIEHYISDDGHYDNSFTSRKTQFLYTHCFSIFKSPIVNKISEGLRKNKIVNPLWLDDRYVIPLTIDYLQTCLELLDKNVNDYS